MHIVVMGAGGIGGYFGAKFAAAGLDVSFIARGDHLRAMRDDGLRIESDDAAVCHIKDVRAAEDGAGFAPADMILFAVKLYDGEQAARLCAPLLADDGFVLTLQNGVESHAMLAPFFGAERVLPGAAYIVSNIEKPGLIRRIGPSQFFRFGELDGTRSRRVRHLSRLCRQAGVDGRCSDNIVQDLWEKFVLLAASSAMTALTRQPFGPLRSDPDIHEIMVASIAEAVAVGRAENIRFSDTVIEDTVDILDNVVGADGKASQLVDLERGKPLELEWLSGAIRRLGKAHGIATPVHSTVYAALKPFKDGDPSQKRGR